MKAQYLACAFLLMVNGSVSAQTACPQGVAAGGAQCGPSSLVNSKESSYAPNSPSLPPARWADSWGAIADDSHGVAGAVTDLDSKREAKRAALQECKRRGGRDCQVAFAYKNQCAVIISGDSGSNVVRAATEERAVEIGMKSCRESSDTNCHIYYSGCSLARRVQ